jgi:hypothetical protein
VERGERRVERRVREERAVRREGRMEGEGVSVSWCLGVAPFCPVHVEPQTVLAPKLYP